MRYRVRAIGHKGEEILGNLDGQRVWEGKNYRRTNWYKRLPHTPTLNNRVAFWKIVKPDHDDYVCEIVHPAPQPKMQMAPAPSCLGVYKL